MKAIAIGGIEDHVHVLLSLPATMTFAKAVQLVKGGSSKWVHEEFPRLKDFGWQGLRSLQRQQVADRQDR